MHRISRLIKWESLHAALYNTYKKSLPPEKTSRLNIYVSGTDGIYFYAVLVARVVGSGKTHGQGRCAGTCVEQIAEGRRRRDKRME